MPTSAIGYTPETPSSAAAEALQGTLHASGSKYPTKGLSATTAVTRTAEDCARFKLLFDRLWRFVMDLRVEVIAGLNVGVNPGVYRKADASVGTFAGSASYSLPNNKTAWKLYLDATTDSLATAAAYPADETTFVPLAQFSTSGGAITALSDEIGLLTRWINASATAIDTTSSEYFTTDSDNAGAGADGGLKHNRGTSGGGEDAALQWDESAETWRALAKDVADTLAALDALALKIGGTTIVESDGTLIAAAIKAARLYTFGANGSTAQGLRLTPAGSAGAPSSGAHSAGELHVDSAGVVWVCTGAGTPGTWGRVADQLASPAAGVVTAAALSNTLADTAPQVSIADASGSSPVTAVVQIKDKQGSNLAEPCLVQIGVYQDADGAANATDATLDATPVTGTFVRWITSGKIGVFKTDSGGLLELDVTMPTIESVYMLAGMAAGSRALDCADVGAITRS